MGAVQIDSSSYESAHKFSYVLHPLTMSRVVLLDRLVASLPQGQQVTQPVFTQVESEPEENAHVDREQHVAEHRVAHT
jgi:hypothetical protein